MLGSNPDPHILLFFILFVTCQVSLPRKTHDPVYSGRLVKFNASYSTVFLFPEGWSQMEGRDVAPFHIFPGGSGATQTTPHVFFLPQLNAILEQEVVKSLNLRGFKTWTHYYRFQKSDSPQPCWNSGGL
jgi:hypothetical protein